MSKYTEQDEPRNILRVIMSGGVLDDVLEDAKNCGHEGSCWDVVNGIADVIKQPLSDYIQAHTAKAVLDGKIDLLDKIAEQTLLARGHLGEYSIMKNHLADLKAQREKLDD